MHELGLVKHILLFYTIHAIIRLKYNRTAYDSDENMTGRNGINKFFTVTAITSISLCQHIPLLFKKFSEMQHFVYV